MKLYAMVWITADEDPFTVEYEAPPWFRNPEYPTRPDEDLYDDFVMACRRNDCVDITLGADLPRQMMFLSHVVRFTVMGPLDESEAPALHTNHPMTPEELLRAFERATGLTVHAVEDRRDGVIWWREDETDLPVFRCTIGDRVMHIDELAENSESKNV